MTKQEVIERVSSEGIKFITPIVLEPVKIDEGRLDQLHMFADSEGIRIHDRKGFTIGLRFQETEVYDVYSVSPSAIEASKSFFVGQGRDDALQQIRHLLKTRPGLFAFNTLANGGHVDITGTNSAVVSQLQRYDRWRYRVPNSYSAFTVTFHDGELSRIQYLWSPFELP